MTMSLPLDPNLPLASIYLITITISLGPLRDHIGAKTVRFMFPSCLINSKRLNSYQYIRVEEMRAFMSRLCTLSGTGKPLKLKDHLFVHTLNIISRVVFGKSCVSSSESKNETSIVTHEELLEMLDELFFLNGVFNIGD